MASLAPQTRPAFSSNDVQHWLNIRRRAGDNAQDFTCRRLLLQRLFEFLEQPHILNRDHRLVGEGFEELDLRRSEGAHLDATCDQSSNEFPLLTKRNGQESAVTGADRHKLENHSVRGHRECEACRARASSETLAHQC